MAERCDSRGHRMPEPRVWEDLLESDVEPRGDEPPVPNRDLDLVDGPVDVRRTRRPAGDPLHRVGLADRFREQWPGVLPRPREAEDIERARDPHTRGPRAHLEVSGPGAHDRSYEPRRGRAR